MYVEFDERTSDSKALKLRKPIVHQPGVTKAAGELLRGYMRVLFWLTALVVLVLVVMWLMDVFRVIDFFVHLYLKARWPAEVR